jgi:hypothetical protein
MVKIPKSPAPTSSEGYELNSAGAVIYDGPGTLTMPATLPVPPDYPRRWTYYTTEGGRFVYSIAAKGWHQA